MSKADGSSLSSGERYRHKRTPGASGPSPDVWVGGTHTPISEHRRIETDVDGRTGRTPEQQHKIMTTRQFMGYNHF